MNRKIYRKIAKKHGVTVKEAKHDIQVAIDKTYQNPTYYAKCVDSKGDIPTPEEFISHVALKVQAGIPQDDTANKK